MQHEKVLRKPVARLNIKPYPTSNCKSLTPPIAPLRTDRRNDQSARLTAPLTWAALQGYDENLWGFYEVSGIDGLKFWLYDFYIG